jgi:glycosyltransferase involved in cell wall biosynthesis
VWNYNPSDKYASLLAEAGVPVISLEGSKLKMLRHIIKERKYHLVQSFAFYLNFYVFLATVFSSPVGIGAIRSRLSLYRLTTPRLIYMLSSRFPRIMIANNRNYNDGKPRKGFGAKTYIVENGLDTDQFSYTTPASQNNIHSVSLGRLGFEKNIPLAIKLVGALVQKGYPIVHTHAGKGPLKAELEVLIKNSELTDKFLLVDEITDINGFISKGDFFLLTSIQEGYPNVVMEAMASGRPILSTDCGDVTLMVENGVHGYVVPTADFGQLVAKASLLIDHSEQRISMGLHAKHKADAQYSIEAYTQRMLDVYEKILNKST